MRLFDVDHAAVHAWLSRYLDAWRSNDPDAIGALFAEDAEYRTGPFDEPWRGRDAIVAGWLGRQDEPGSWAFEVTSVDVADGAAFIEGRATYPDEDRRFANLWRVELDQHGRATRYVEWWMERRR